MLLEGVVILRGLAGLFPPGVIIGFHGVAVLLCWVVKALHGLMIEVFHEIVIFKQFMVEVV
jgi:hypothetical protein